MVSRLVLLRSSSYQPHHVSRLICLLSSHANRTSGWYASSRYMPTAQAAGMPPPDSCQPHPTNIIPLSALVLQMQNNEDIPIWLREASAAIIKHMNDDHSDVIVATLYGQHGIFDTEAEMTELETDGYYAVSRSGRYFLNFDDHCASAKEYKEALIKHAHEYKNYEVSSA